MNTVDRALHLIKLIVDKPMRIQEISNQLRIHKSSASRLVQTLQKHHFLKNNNGLIEPGYGILQLAHMIQDKMDLRHIAKEYIEKLGEETKETIHLAILDDFEIVYVDKKDSPYPVRMHSSIGKRSPVYCTGVGKAILAYLEDKQLKQVLKKITFHKYTKNTICSKEALLEDLKKIRAQGVAMDNSEHEEEVCCIAAPIFNFEKQVIASISITTTTSRRSLKELLGYKDILLDTAQSISQEMGYLKES